MAHYFRFCPACDLRFDVVAPMREAHLIRCPSCSGNVDIDVRAQGAPAMPRTNLHGDAKISRELRIHPHEVEKARRDFGDEGGHCWQADGRLKFDHMADADKFFKKLGKIRKRVEEKQAAKAAANAPTAIA